MAETKKPLRPDQMLKFIESKISLLTTPQLRSLGQIAHMACTNAFPDNEADREAARRRVILINQGGTEGGVILNLTELATISPDSLRTMYGIVLARFEEMDRPR